MTRDTAGSAHASGDSGAWMTRALEWRRGHAH
jgi:hypothetical protein